MGLISNAAIAFSMSADAFAAALSKGVVLTKPRLSYAMRIGLVFGVVETITPLIGWVLGVLASSVVESVDHWVAFGILAIIGVKMILEAFHRDEPVKKETHGYGVLIITAIGTSIDAMAVGATFALLDINIWLMALSIGAATWVMATIGIMAGHHLGTRAGKWAELLGGLCLIAIGTHILLTHLAVI